MHSPFCSIGKKKAELPGVPRQHKANTVVQPLLRLECAKVECHEMLSNMKNLPAQVNKNIWAVFSDEEK